MIENRKEDQPMKKRKKKIKKIIAKVMLYTICWRNVDRHVLVWIYDSYNVKLGGKNDDIYNIVNYHINYSNNILA